MKTFLRLMKYTRPYYKYLIPAMLALIILTLSQLYAPIVIKNLVKLIVHQDENLKDKAIMLSLILALVYLIQALCQYIRGYYSHVAAWKFVSDMRIRVYDHLQKLSLRYYHDKQTGQLMSRASNDTATLENLIAHVVPDLIINVLVLVGVAVMLFSINTTLALLSLITIPLLVIKTFGFVKKVLPNFKQSQQTLAEFNAALHDSLSGIKEIQVFNQQEREKNKIAEKSQTYTTHVLRALRLSSKYHPSIQFLNNIGTVLVVAFGGILASMGKVPVEDIVAFLLYLGMFYQPISTLGRISEDLQNALAGAGRVFEVLDTESDVKEAEHPIVLKKALGSICFDHVSFSYLSNVDVLKNIDLTIQPGQMIALVGPTGVGKSTFASLVTRFYDPSAGRVLLDGYDIRDLTLKSLRDNISIVLQDIFLFNGTIAENIAYGVPSTCIEEIVEASKIARAHEFIQMTENGYDTLIGERGIKLSGGQKQRLSIARAVLRNTPILILDEATASVDVETEQLIHDAIDHVIRDRTTIVIAHRLSSVKKADKIIVLHEGKIKESGTHHELIKKGGLYSHLCKIQFRENDT